MTAYEFQVIQEIQEADQDAAACKVLDERIGKAVKQLHSLEKQEKKMNEQNEAIQQKFNELSNSNTKLMSKIKKTDDGTIINGNGSFFIQLRHIEAEIERWEASREGLTAITHNLQGAVSAASATNNRLRKRTEELREQQKIAQLNESAKKGEQKTAEANLFQKTTELNTLKEVVEELKEKIKTAASGMKSLSPKETAMLVAQKDVLRKEIESRSKQLENLKQDEKSLTTKFSVQRSKRNKTMASSSSTLNWLNERSTLLAKVKNARKELKNLDVNERGALKSVERNHQQIEDLNYNAEEIKLAIIAATKCIPNEVSDFMNDAIVVEKKYSAKLEKKLGQIDKSFSVINDFKEKTNNVMKLDEEVAENEARKILLTDELNNIRKLTL